MYLSKPREPYGSINRMETHAHVYRIEGWAQKVERDKNVRMLIPAVSLVPCTVHLLFIWTIVCDHCERRGRVVCPLGHIPLGYKHICWNSDLSV